MTRCLLPLLALFPSLSLAQVNTEQYRSEEDAGWATTIEIDFGLRKGNVDLLQAGFDIGSRWQRDANSVLLIADGGFATKRTLGDYADSPEVKLLDTEAQYINKVLAHARYNRELSPRVILEVFSQAERNDFLLMDRRLIAGTGPRLKLWEGETGTLAMGIAYMLEQEILDTESIGDGEAPITLVHRGTSYLSGSLLLSETSSIGGTVYVQPRITDPSDLRALGELQLEVAINEALSLAIEFSFRHDSKPPEVNADTPALAPTDLTVGQAITLVF